MRSVAIALAVLTAIGQLLTFAYGEAQFDAEMLGQLTGEVGPWWSRALWAVGWASPWAIGAAVLTWGAPRAGTAILVAVAVLAADEVVSLVTLGVSAAGTAGGGGTELAVVFGNGLAWAFGTAAGICAWLARPRGDWRVAAPGPGGWFTAAAIAAWLPTAFRSTAFAPPGAPRRFLELRATDLEFASADRLLYPVIVALLLLVAPRLRPMVAGVVTLTFALPQLVSQAATLRTSLERDLTIPTPAGVLGMLGVAILVVIGIVWVVRGRPRVSDAATDPDPAAEG